MCKTYGHVHPEIGLANTIGINRAGAMVEQDLRVKSLLLELCLFLTKFFLQCFVLYVADPDGGFRSPVHLFIRPSTKQKIVQQLITIPKADQNRGKNCVDYVAILMISSTKIVKTVELPT